MTNIYRVVVTPDQGEPYTHTITSDEPMRQGQATTRAMLAMRRSGHPLHPGTGVTYRLALVAGTFAPYPGESADFTHPGVTLVDQADL